MSKDKLFLGNTIGWELTNGRCYYCGCKMTDKQSDIQSSTPPPNYLTVDHFIPVSKGGIKSSENRVPSCKKCNEIKDNLLIEEFRKASKKKIFYFEKMGYPIPATN